jgi:hypothetical protein
VSEKLLDCEVVISDYPWQLTQNRSAIFDCNSSDARSSQLGVQSQFRVRYW